MTIWFNWFKNLVQIFTLIFLFLFMSTTIYCWTQIKINVFPSHQVRDPSWGEGICSCYKLATRGRNGNRNISWKGKKWFHDLIEVGFLLKWFWSCTKTLSKCFYYINYRSQEENTPYSTNHKVVIYSFIIHQLMILTRNIFVRLNINWRAFVDEVYNQLGWFLQVSRKWTFHVIV